MLMSAITTGSLLTTVISVAYLLTTLGIVALIVMENRNPLKSLAWITVLLLLPVVGIVLYLFFGRSLRNHRMISRRRRRKLLVQDRADAHCPIPEGLTPESRQLITMARAMGCSPFFDGNNAEIFIDGRSKFEALKRDLSQASEYILLQYYIFDNDLLGNAISDILIERARAGVKVRVIYDDLGSLSVKNSFFERMSAAGVDVHPFFRLTFPHFASRANWRNHRKLVVIDGHTGYIGGMNIADRYVDGGKDFDLWRDIHLRVTGPAVSALHYSFGVDWNFMGQPLIPEKAVPAPAPAPERQETVGNVGMQLVTGGPTNQWSVLGYLFIKAIATARKRVFIQTPYFLPSEGLLNALQVAALSRIDVRIMMPLRSDSRLLTYASRSFVAECLRAGIKIYFFREGMLHSKMAVIDDEISTVGSTNFDFRSFEHNFEGNMLCYSEEMNRRLRRVFEADMRHSDRILFHHWRRRPLGERIAESVLRLISPIL